MVKGSSYCQHAGLWVVTAAMVFFTSTALVSDTEALGEFELGPGPRTYTSQSSYFHVASPDFPSAVYVSRLGEKLSLQMERWLPLPQQTHLRTLVRLEPTLLNSQPHPFRITRELGGIVVVSIRWDETTQREDVERALANALLTRVAIWNYGNIDGLTIPLWLEVAVQQELRSLGDPAFVDHLVEKVRELGHLSVEEIVRRDRSRSVDERFTVSAYWFLRHLQEQGSRSGALRHFVVRTFRGEDPLHALAATYGEQFRRQEDLSLWWAVGLYESLRGRIPMQKGFADSQRWLLAFSQFTYAQKGDEVRLNLKELYNYREEPLVLRDVRQRLERLHVDVHRIHPFHHNSMLSLMYAMHAFSDGDEDEFEEMYARFQEDLREGEELYLETRRILDLVEAEFSR